MAVAALNGRTLEGVADNAEIPSSVTCLFGARSGRVKVVANVVSATPLSGTVRISLSMISVESEQGRRPVEEFVAALTGKPTWPGATWDREGTLRRMNLPDENAVLERREEARAKSIREVEVQAGSKSLTAVLSDVSLHGARLETLFTLPRAGQPVVLNLKIPVGRLELAVRAHGCTVWSHVPTDKGAAPAFGVHFDRIDDGAGGRQWSRFVAGESEQNGAIPAYRRGKPLPEDVAVRARA